MTWNWQKKDWPHFTYDEKSLEEKEKEFLYQSGILRGSYRHIKEEDKNTFLIDILSDEALKTSEIEGEYLNRDSLQSSIRRHFGLQTDSRKIPPAEKGICDLMLNLYSNFSAPLSHQTLVTWHSMLTYGRRDLKDIGCYRTHPEPMQIVSGYIHAPKVHFEAPSSKDVAAEMNSFISWFNETGPQGKKPLPALTRAGLAHLYFVSIHPFEDGNGRIGRALCEKTLSQFLNQPTLISLSRIIERKKKSYYEMLEKSNKSNEVSNWLNYFSQTILEAQNYTRKMIEFLIQKAKLYDKLQGQLNPRQEKVITRLFREGPEGFKGGLSAENYLKITNTSRATATRDLQDLVNKGAFIRKGELKGTRYALKLISPASDTDTPYPG